MNNFSEQLKKEAQAIRLTQHEKDQMRARVFGVHKTPSPYFFYNVQFVGVARYALAAVVMVAFVGGGTVSAAQGALPGDLLYPVKISINETVEQALATTPEKKLQTEVRLAERRLAEAEALEEEDRLDPETTEALEREFDRHVSNAVAFAEVVESSKVKAEEDEAKEEDSLALRTERSERGVAQDESEDSEAGFAVTMALKVEDTDGAEAIATFEAPAALMATTGTSSSEVEEGEDEDEQDVFEALKLKRDMFRELRERAERRGRGLPAQAGEVRGTFESRSEWQGIRDEDEESRGEDGGRDD